MNEMLMLPLCDSCGERTEMMMSVANLVGHRLSLEEVAAELCGFCSDMLRFMLEEN